MVMSLLSATLVRSFRIARNLLIDLRFGKVLAFTYVTQRHSANSDYRALAKMFKNRIRESDVLVDVGCGHGRVINWWLGHHPEAEIVGLEIDENIARQVQKRLHKHPNVTIVSGDAIENIPENGTIFYLYNPFGAEMVEALRDRLALLFEPSQGILLLYYNSKHVSVFEHNPGWSVEMVDLGGHRSAPFDELASIRMVRVHHAPAQTSLMMTGARGENTSGDSAPLTSRHSSGVL